MITGDQTMDCIIEHRARIRDRIEVLVEEKLAEISIDDDHLEAAIGQNADLILEAVRKLHEDRDMDAFTMSFDRAIAAHLEPIARQWAEREIYIERGLA